VPHADCEHLVFTWAHRTLESSGGGLGVVLRSSGWSRVEDLGVDAVAVATLPSALRQRRGFLAVACYRLGESSLLALKRTTGNDGTGRPGNYLAELVWDPRGVLGSLDLLELEAVGFWMRERAIDAEPEDAADRLAVPWARTWRGLEAGPPSDGLLPLASYETFDRAREGFLRAAHHCPPDLLNGLEVEVGDAWAGSGLGPATRPEGADLDPFEGIAEAARTGMAATESWWARGLPRTAWSARASDYVVSHAPVGALDLAGLLQRWRLEAQGSDSGTPAAPERLLTELARQLRNGVRISWPPTGPPLRAVVEAGLDSGLAPGGAVELLAEQGTPEDKSWLVRTLIERDAADLLSEEAVKEIVRESPESLTPAVSTWVARRHRFFEGSRGSGSSTEHPDWAAYLALQHLRGVRGLRSSRDALRVLDDAELAGAVEAALARGARAVAVWDRLTSMVSEARRDRAFAGAGPEAVRFLLGDGSREVTPRETLDRARDLWPLIVDSLGWRPSLASAPPRDAREAVRTRRLIAALAILLAVAAVVVAILLRP
jgi:hypothetical protein